VWFIVFNFNEGIQISPQVGDYPKEILQQRGVTPHVWFEVEDTVVLTLKRVVDRNNGTASQGGRPSVRSHCLYSYYQRV